MRRAYRGADSGEDEPTLSAAESHRRVRTMYATRSRIIGAAGFLIGAASAIPGLVRDSGAADGPPQTHPAVGSPKEAGKTIRQVLREAARAVQVAPDPASRTYALVEIIKA
jgi:hypothetical protein